MAEKKILVSCRLERQYFNNLQALAEIEERSIASKVALIIKQYIAIEKEKQLKERGTL